MSRELASQQPGYWSLRRYVDRDVMLEYLVFNCPCGCRYGDCVRLIRQNELKPHEVSWHWNGSLDRPTLQPSLRRNVPCKWHGFLIDGVWSACADGAPLAPNIYRIGMQPPPETHEVRA
jgi:hypothetical protein